MIIPEKVRKMQLYHPAPERAAVCLDTNESCFPLTDECRAAVCEAMAQTAFHRYPDPQCTECCALAAAYFGVPSDCIAAGNGSDGLIDALLGTFFSAGDTLVCADPDFSMYRFYADLRELSIRALPRAKGLPEPNALIEAARDAQGVIFSNPCNPTGQGLRREAVIALLDALSCTVIVDEAYMDFFGESVAMEAARRDNVIVLKTCSKAIGLAGIRLGFAIAAPEQTSLIRQCKSPFDVSALTQAAGAVLLRRPDLLRERCEALRERREALHGLLSDWAARREGARAADTVANFVLLYVPSPHLLYKHLWSQGVGVRLLPDCLRVTAGTETEHEALRAALESFTS